MTCGSGCADDLNRHPQARSVAREPCHQPTPCNLSSLPRYKGRQNGPRRDIDDTLYRIRDGDRQAFAEIGLAYQVPLCRFLGAMGLSRAQAEDIAQETLIRAWNSLGHYASALSRFSTWLFTIARRLALNEIARAENRSEAIEGRGEAAASRLENRGALVTWRARVHRSFDGPRGAVPA